MIRHIRALAVACAIVGAAASASAQGTAAPVEPGSDARFRLGALRFTPALAINNLGVDSNVFNSTTDPRQDTTAAVGPVVDLWLRAGRARLAGQVSGQYLYFKTYGNQRAWNTGDNLRLDLPLGRIQPFVRGAYLNTRDRPGFEIDSRIRQKQATWQAGGSIRLGGHTSLVLSGMQSYVAYDDSQYNAVSVAAALDRRTDSQNLQFRDQLTPYTTLFLEVETGQDRFDQAVERNADSVKSSVGFSLQPAALISGEVSVGFRHFNPLRLDVSNYDGLVATTSVRSTLGNTRIRLSENRDVSFSYDTLHPYYVQTSTSLDVTRRLARSWDAVARAGYTVLTYRALAGSTEPVASDRVSQFGFGIGYLPGRTFRVGLETDYYRRRAETTLAPDYSGYRAGLSIKFGLPQ